MLVLTVDQRGSRRDRDRVADLLSHTREARTIRPFDRTAGDEVQAVFNDARAASQWAIDLAADGHWSVGVGVGPVEHPLPRVTRAGRGGAFEAAREAVTRAKHSPNAIAVSAHGSANNSSDFRAEDATTALALVVGLITRRTRNGAHAVELVTGGLSQLEVAAHLGISKQAVSQRLLAANWHIEGDARELAARVLATLDRG